MASLKLYNIILNVTKTAQIYKTCFKIVIREHLLML